MKTYEAGHELGAFQNIRVLPLYVDHSAPDAYMFYIQAAANPVWTEEQLGQRAEELFRQHKYNFVLVSSTNLDSIMEFYHHTPEGMQIAGSDIKEKFYV